MTLPTPESQPKFERVLVVPPTMYMPDDVEGFYAQSQRDQLDQLGVYYGMYSPGVDELFEITPDLGWVAVGLPTGEIVARGSYLESAPDKIKEIEVLAREAVTRCVPFVFARPTMERFYLSD